MSSRDECLQDFWTFCTEGLEMPLYEQPHREMVDFIADLSQKNKLMLVPRECWKTSLGTTAYSLWRVLRAYYLEDNPAFRVLIDSANVRLSQFVLEAIVSYVKNGVAFRDIFGTLYKKDEQWETNLNLAFRSGVSGGIREPNFLASGIDAQKTGLHFELLVLDDLVTEKNFGSLAQREKTYRHYRLMYGIMSFDGGQQTTEMSIYGTRWHDDDLYGRILKNEDKSVAEGHKPIFAFMQRAAISDDGELYFPAKLTKDELERRKRAMHGMFWAQFMNDPNKESAPFKIEQLKFKPLREFPGLHTVRLCVDPAVKQDEVEHGDFNALTVLGWDRWNNPWMLDCSMRRDLDGKKMIDETLEFAVKWQVDSILMEQSHHDGFDILFRQEMFRRNIEIPIFFVKAPRLAGKESRWAPLQTIAQRAGVHVAEEIPEVVKQEVRDQWSRAPFATYDDFMDSLAMHLSYMGIDGADEDVRQREPELRDPQELLLQEATVRAAAGFQKLSDVFPHLRPKQDGDEWVEDETAEDEQSEIEDLMEKTFG